MSVNAGTPPDAGPDYEPVGPWWTYDAPSLRIADAHHRYVSVWTAGDAGPSVLLVPPASADHRIWEPVLPDLTGHFVVHAVDLRPARGDERVDVDAVTTALAASGADTVVAMGDAAAAALAALERGAVSRVVLWDPPAAVLPGLPAPETGAPPTVQVIIAAAQLGSALTAR